MEKNFKSSWGRIVTVFAILILQFSFITAIQAQTPEWLLKLQRVKIFESTQNDVERIFDDAKIINIFNLVESEKSGWGKRVEYETKFGELSAIYSTGNCFASRNKLGYNVDKDIVVSMIFTPKTKINVKTMNLKLKKFKIVPQIDVPNTYTLLNYKEGIEIFVEGDKVEFIEFTHPVALSKYDCEKILE